MKLIRVKKENRVGIIFLNRPQVLNAFNDQMSIEVREQIQKFNEDNNIGAIILTGEGNAFSAGADVARFEDTANGIQKPLIHDKFAKWPNFIRDSKPVICAINGYAIGMGITLTLSCDIRIMSDSAKVSFRFAAVGLTPEFASSHLLNQIVGYGKAMEFMLTGKFIDSHEALSTGLVNHVFSDEEMLNKSVEFAQQIAFNPSWQLTEIKKMMWAHKMSDDIDSIMLKENMVFRESQDTIAHKEFLKAFRENRSPNYY
jgi:2-(1,2-epoxy-1,2-dihydrophenyl)acetyl-CoA isomerase